MTNENETFYICVAVKKTTDTDIVGEAVKYFEQKCEDEDTARGAFDILRRSLVDRGDGDNSELVP